MAIMRRSLSSPLGRHGKIADRRGGQGKRDWRRAAAPLRGGGAGLASPFRAGRGLREPAGPRARIGRGDRPAASGKDLLRNELLELPGVGRTRVLAASDAVATVARRAFGI